MTRELKAYLAELVGTFLPRIHRLGRLLAPLNSTGTLIPAFSHGLALFIIVIITGRVPGRMPTPR